MPRPKKPAKTPQGRPRKWSMEVVKEVRRRRRQRQPWAKIAADLKIPQSTAEKMR